MLLCVHALDGFLRSLLLFVWKQHQVCDFTGVMWVLYLPVTVESGWQCLKRRGLWIERLTGQMVHHRLECWENVTIVLKVGGPVWNMQEVLVFSAQTGRKCIEQTAHFPWMFFFLWAVGHHSYQLHLLIRPWWDAGLSSMRGTDVPSGQIGWKPDDSWIGGR